MQWIPAEEQVRVAGREIGGMVYVGDSRRLRIGGITPLRALIDPALRVQNFPDREGYGLRTCPQYWNMDPVVRSTYLDWLAGGRSDLGYNPGYVLLYFYGLETRFFLDETSDREREQLIGEVERLNGIYGNRNAIRDALKTFIDAAALVMGRSLEPEPDEESDPWTLSFRQKLAIARLLSKEEPLSARIMYDWYRIVRGIPHSLPWRRATERCESLFLELFKERFPEGLRVRVPERRIRFIYQAASTEFKINLRAIVGELPDPEHARGHWRSIKGLVNEVHDRLASHTRFILDYPELRGSVQAHSLLPERLRTTRESESISRFRKWADKAVAGDGLVTIDEAFDRVNGAIPEELSNPTLFDLHATLISLGYGMAPDPRRSLRKPELGEPVVLFALKHEYTLPRKPSAKYRQMVTALSIGAYASHGDGQFGIPEKAYLQDAINGSEMSKSEQEYLVAELEWMCAVPPPVSSIRPRLKRLSGGEKVRLLRLAIAAAAADQPLNSHEIRALEMICKAAAIPFDQLYSELHAFAIDQEPVTVRPPRRASKGFAIRKRPQSRNGVRLSKARIKGILSDSSEARVVLDEVFGDNLAPPTGPDSAHPTHYGGLRGLDSRHENFLTELMAQPAWSEADLQAVAVKHRLMTDGAIETLNEWSYLTFDADLVEEYDGYRLDPELVERITDLQSAHA